MFYALYATPQTTDFSTTDIRSRLKWEEYEAYKDSIKEEYNTLRCEHPISTQRFDDVFNNIADLLSATSISFTYMDLKWATLEALYAQGKAQDYKAIANLAADFYNSKNFDAWAGGLKWMGKAQFDCIVKKISEALAKGETIASIQTKTNQYFAMEAAQRHGQQSNKQFFKDTWDQVFP